MEYSKYQKAIFEEYINTNNNIVIEAVPGCLGISTPILMYDGSLKKVQDIKVGDKVMGLDSTPRNVLSVNNGIDDLYKIIPRKGDSFICNSKHILTLHSKIINRSMKIYKNTKHSSPIVDKELMPLYKKGKVSLENGNYSNYKLQRYSVEFKEKKLNIDPYILGLWLAEGTKQNGSLSFSICGDDIELIDFLMNLKIDDLIPKKTKEDGNCFRIDITNQKCRSNKLRNEFSRCIEGENIFIPKDYLINSRENRLQLLAGLLDGDGYLGNNCFEITTKFNQLNEDILFLCRSLGLAAYSNKKTAEIKKINFKGEYNRISISGDVSMIPNKLKRKKGKKRKQIKNVLRTGFRIEKIGKGDWYGFSVDGDNRFLLGDFTVTHNSGKTFTLLELLKRTPTYKKSIFLAFNKSIAAELKYKVPEYTDVSTIHSLGYKVLRNNVKTKFKVTEYKNWILFKGDLSKKKFKDEKEKNIYKFTISKIVDLYKMNLCKSKEDLMEIMESYSIPFGDDEVKDSLKLIEILNKYNNSYHSEFMIDFTDMLYLTVKLVDPKYYPKYDVVLCDESQDLNRVQQFIIENITKKNGRRVFVGDSKQSIYLFQGANKEIFNELKTKEKTTELPLSVSYRCAKNIVNEANKVFDVIKPFDKNIDGVVRYGDLSEVENGDFIICRNNLPLIEAWISLTLKGKKAHIMGKDFSIFLNKIIKKVSDLNKDEVEIAFEDMLNKKEESLKEKGIKNPKNNEAYNALQESISISKILSNYFGSYKEVENKINDIFSDENIGTTLCTIHKSKGLEADRVFILSVDLIPSKYAQTQQELYAEYCLKYVGITRAKKELVYLD